MLLGLAVACLLAGHVAIADELALTTDSGPICPFESPAVAEAGLPEQPLEGAVFASPGLCPTLCPMTCPSTWTCSFGNCVCD